MCKTFILLKIIWFAVSNSNLEKVLSHFTFTFQVRYRGIRNKIWCEIVNCCYCTVCVCVCEQCDLCGVNVLTHHKSFTAVGMTQHHQGFGSRTVRCHVWLSRQSHCCCHWAASLTRESVHVPRHSHEPDRVPEFTRPWKGGLGVDQRGLCAEKRTCECAVSTWRWVSVKLKPFA